MNEHKICFIIAHKYSRNCPSYIKITVDNIQKFYPESFIVIVDNNSTNIEDIYRLFLNYSNLNLVINDSNSKYELGAYIRGLNWLIEKNFLDYDYYMFLQDTLVFMKKYDFNILENNNIKATPIIFFTFNEGCGIEYLREQQRTILEPLNLFNEFDNMVCCWGSNFIIHKDKFMKLHGYIKDVVLTTKIDSEASERYMGRIIYELNNRNENFSIDGNMCEYCSKTDLYCINLNYANNNVHFQKKLQHMYDKN